MIRADICRDIVFRLICAASLVVVVPIGIVLMLVFTLIDFISRLSVKPGARHGRR